MSTVPQTTPCAPWCDEHVDETGGCPGPTTVVRATADRHLATWSVRTADGQRLVVVDGRGVALELSADEVRAFAAALLDDADRIEDPASATLPMGEAAMPSWQTTPCPAWCTWAPLSEREMPADRSHVSVGYRRALSLELPVETVGGEWEPDYQCPPVAVRARGRADCEVAKGDLPEVLTLTVADAEALAEGPRSLVEEARRG